VSSLAGELSRRSGVELPAARETTSTGWAACLAVAIVAAAILPRWWLLDRFYLDFDESMHFQVAKEPTLWEAYRASRIHTHPPLVFLMYHLWLPMGDSEVMLRIPSFVLGIAGLWAGYLWLREMTDAWSALAGLCLLAFAVPMIHIAIQMRGYTLWLLFVFGGLYARERAFRAGGAAPLAGAALCLGLAMLTHYATAWILFVLGVVDLARLIGVRPNRRFVLAWVVCQTLLAALAVWLFVDHASTFRGTNTQWELWANWMMDVPFKPGPLFAVKAAIWKCAQFFLFLAGRWWFALLLCVLVGAFAQWQRARRTQGSLGLAAAQSGLIVLPLLLGMLLFARQIYPLGGTRHSLWLVPWVVLGLAAGVQAVAAWSPRRAGPVIAAGLLAWIGDVSVREVVAVQNHDTPQKLREFAELIRQTIPPHEPILTDDCTRNVLDYYLARKTRNHGRELPHGYKEYVFDEYRLTVLPRFHFYYTNLRRNWPQLASALGDHVEQPLWIVYLGYEIPMMKLDLLSQRLPYGQLLGRHSFPAVGAELLRVRLMPPKLESTETVGQPAAPAIQKGG